MNKKSFSILTLIVSLIAVIVLYPKLQHHVYLRAFVHQWGWISIFVDLLIIALLMLFPVIPFILIAGVNILLYGWIGGFFLSLSGSLLGDSLGFWLARNLGQEWAQTKIKKLGKWGSDIEGNSYFIILISRLIPILPSAAVNYAAGLSQITYPSFLFATFLGQVPMVIWESWVGHSFWRVSHHPGQLLLSLAVGAPIFGVVLLYAYQSTKHSKNSLL